MSRVGFSDNDSDAALGRMLPLAEPTGDADEEEREEKELPNQRYIYENEAQSKRRRYRCRETYEVAGRGTGKTTDIAEHVKETSLRIPRSSISGLQHQAALHQDMACRGEGTGDDGSRRRS